MKDHQERMEALMGVNLEKVKACQDVMKVWLEKV
jgi:hypothetical protein